MLPRVLRASAEISATMLLAELVADMSYERRAEVSYEDEAQFVTNVTEYNSIKSAIHDGLVNHIRRDVLGSDKKAMRISTTSIEELVKDVLPEDFESPVERYEDKSVWFEIMRDLHDQKNLRKVHNDQRCFSTEEIRQMASFSSSPSPPSSSSSSSTSKVPKNGGELLEQILSAYTIEQGRQLQLRQQVDHNFTLCEQEMNRQLDIQDAEEYPVNYRLGMMVGLGVIGRLFFLGTDRLLGGPAVNIFAHKLSPVALPRQQIFRRFGGVTLMILFASYMRNYLRDHREEFNEDEKTAEEEFDGFLAPIFGKLWDAAGHSLPNANGTTTTTTSDEDPDTSIVTIQKIVDLKRNDRQVWAGETPTDPLPLSKRIYYQAALPLFQLFAFNHLLLRSLITYLPGPIAHVLTAVSFASHYAYVVTPFHYDQSLYEQGYRGMLRTMVVQTWSHLLQYPSRSFWLLFPLFGSSESSIEEMVLPDPTSYMIEGTERYQALLFTFQIGMAALSGVGEVAHPRQPTTTMSVPKIPTTPSSPLPEEVANELIQVFSSDHFTTETRSKRLYQRDAIDLWLMWERYLRSKQAVATNASDTNGKNDSFVAQETPYGRSPSILSQLSKQLLKWFFPEIAVHMAKHPSAQQPTPATPESSASKPVNDVLPVTTYRPVIDTILTSLQVRVMEGVFHQRQKELSTEAFLSFASFLASPGYVKGVANVKEFLSFAKDQRRMVRDFTEDEILDIVQASTSTIWRADELFLRYYEPFLFQKVEQMAAGRVRDPALANGARDVQNYLNILKSRVQKQLQWQYGMTDETLLFIFKTHSEKYPSTKTLLAEWKQFYSTSEFGAQRMKNIIGLDKSLMKQRLYLQAMNRSASRANENQPDKKSNAEK